MTIPNGPEAILGRLRFVLLALLGCRSKPAPPDPQIVTSLVEDAGVEAASEPAVRCARPARAVRVGSVDKNLVWSGDVLVEWNGTAAYDPATLAKTMASSPPDGGVTSPRRVEQRGSKAVVVDSSGNELFEHSGCKSDIGEEFPYDVGERGRFLICRTDRMRVTLFDIDDPKHPSVRIDRLHEFVSPDESYVVGVPYRGRNSWSKFVPRAHVDHRSVLGAPKDISSDVDFPESYPKAKVVFCGNGELFAVYAAHPGDKPPTVDVFDGTSGALLAQGTGTIASGDVARSYASFDAWGRYLILVTVDTVSPGVGATTYVYRLER